LIYVEIGSNPSPLATKAQPSPTSTAVYIVVLPAHLGRSSNKGSVHLSTICREVIGVSHSALLAAVEQWTEDLLSRDRDISSA
jgi:hypothetical protein